MIRLLFLLFFVIQSTTVSCKDSDEPSLDDLFGSSEKKAQPKGKEVKPEIIKQTPRRKPETKIEKEHFAIMQTLDDIKKIAEPLKGFVKTEEAKKELEKKTQERTQLEKKVAEQQKKSYRSSGRDYHDSSSSRSSRSGGSYGRSSGRGDSGDDFWKSFGSGGGRSDSSSSGRIGDRYQSSKADRGFDDEDKSKIGSDAKGTDKTTDDKKNVYSKQEAEDEKRQQKDYDSKLAAAKKALTTVENFVKDISKGQPNEVAAVLNSKYLSEVSGLELAPSEEIKKIDDAKGKQILGINGTIANALRPFIKQLLHAATYDKDIEKIPRIAKNTDKSSIVKKILENPALGLSTESYANARASELVAAFNDKNKKQITDDTADINKLKPDGGGSATKNKATLVTDFTTLRTKLDNLANTFPGSPPQPLLDEFAKIDKLVADAEGLSP